MKPWTSILVIAVAVAMVGSAPGDEKKKEYQDPPRTYVNVKSFSATCDAVWTAAISLLTEVGLAPHVLDQQRGFASLKWTKGQTEGWGSKNDVNLYTTLKPESWSDYDDFRADSATLLVTPDGSNCRCQIKLAYAALRRDHLSADGYHWHALESNSFFEEMLLAIIDEQIKDRPLTVANANPGISQSAAERSDSTPMASVSITSNPSGAEIEIDGRFVGSTPSKFDVAAGKYQVDIRKSGHEDWTRKLDLLQGANITLQAELVKKPEPAVPDIGALLSPKAPEPQLSAGTKTAEASNPQASNDADQRPSATSQVSTVKPEVAEAVPGQTKIVCPENIKQVPFSSPRPNRKMLSCGEAVTIVKETPPWVRVRTLDNIEGTVSERFVSK
jgi:hypothetical protein